MLEGKVGGKRSDFLGQTEAALCVRFQNPRILPLLRFHHLRYFRVFFEFSVSLFCLFFLFPLVFSYFRFTD